MRQSEKNALNKAHEAFQINYGKARFCEDIGERLTLLVELKNAFHTVYMIAKEQSSER